ncbi:Pentatricopeptide repeat-containing protein [Acorus gramineus]|uniref:Pentatricopeptide repeat-containing protein n=1 Tax=Acorus gramineus TaxID=55184 RepID=A0AAV9BZ91_ACOGR|nr:Pentatricopeptide repeat-containing protein [Acorus gramineus]
MAINLLTYIDSPTPSQGQKIHSHLIKSGFRPNTNISIKLQILYIKCGQISYARQMFDQIPHQTLSAYNFMISAYIKQCRTDDSLALLRKLAFSDEKPDEFSFSMALKLSSSLNSLNLAREVHTQIVKCGCESDDVLFTALVDSYAKNARVGHARLVFDEMSRRNVVCATAMITGYMNQGSVGDAEEIFNRTEDKDVVVFNAMIEGYSRTAETATRALEFYDSMRGLGFSPTVSTFSSVIGACSILAAFDFATQVHAQLVKFNALANVKPASALVDTYCKCGKIGEARALFDRMAERNVFSWTSMIDGYGRNGVPREALRLFEQMRKTEKVRPNHVTFLGVLSACAHAGWVCEGREIFESMERDYALTPRMEHYACMVDALGRAGRLGEALRFIKGMPERAGLDVWGALLGAARVHGDVGMANLAVREMFEGERGGRAGAYVALSNALAEAGEWEGVREVREMMVERGVAKNSGQSWVGADEGLRGFGVGDQNR